MASLLTLAEIEFCQLMAQVGFRPALAVGLGLLWLSLLDGQFPEWGLAQPGITFVMLAALAWQVFHRQGSPVANWALTITGGLYLGICGSNLMRLRNLPPDGLWWALAMTPSVMFADTCAYFVGRVWGRRKLAPVLSPHKTWEGYVAGVLGGALLTALLAHGVQTWVGAGTSVNWLHGLILGFLIAILAPLGDLGISMIKRRAGAKDSGTILPGHGGALDRVDSVLWAIVIAYYYVLWFVS
jgi:phosphatidate cytidylyltransferase